MTFGIGLHVLVALVCAIHAVRTGQPIYWLLILFMFPLLGSVVYVVAIWLPSSRLQHGTQRAMSGALSAATKAIDPGREIRDARAAFDATPTAQNRTRLADALLSRGDASEISEAADHYAACLTGPFATDNEMRLAASRAFVAAGRDAQAVDALEAVRTGFPHFKPHDVTVLLARAYAGAGRDDDARHTFESAIERFASYEARAEYAIFAYRSGDTTTAKRVDDDAQRMAADWNALSRTINEPTVNRLAAARKA